MQGQKHTASVCPKRLIQLSAVGEVFLEGTCPLSRRPQTAKSPCPCFRAHGERDKKRQLFEGGTDVLRNHRSRHKNHRAGTKRTASVCPKRLIQLSAVGEVFLEGTCPLSRRPQTAKSPCPCFRAHGERDKKRQLFAGSEQDRSPCETGEEKQDLCKVPVGRCKRNFS